MAEMRRLAVMVVAVACMSACGDDEGTPSADAGPPGVDAGERVDAGGGGLDASLERDAASATDSATPSDAATAPDASHSQLDSVDGPIKLDRATRATWSATQTLVGSYPGTLARVYDGQTTKWLDSCTIRGSAQGQLSVSAGDDTVSALLDGEEMDTIVVPASSQDPERVVVANQGPVDDRTNNVRIEVDRGYVTHAKARATTGNNSYLRTIDCWVIDPNPRHVGDAKPSNKYSSGGATASDIDPALVGTYANGDCTVTVSDDGTIRVQSGASDLSARIGGDGYFDSDSFFDSVSSTPSGIELQAATPLQDDQFTVVQLRKSIMGVWSGRSRDAHNSYASENNCNNLTKK